jgi:hypothetical protein
MSQESFGSRASWKAAKLQAMDAAEIHAVQRHKVRLLRFSHEMVAFLHSMETAPLAFCIHSRIIDVNYGDSGLYVLDWWEQVLFNLVLARQVFDCVVSGT